MEYVVERVAFEKWVKDQLNVDKVLLTRNDEGVYDDELINGMFIGFISGWIHGQSA